MVVEDDVIPLMSRLQQHLTLLGHFAHVYSLILAVWCDAQHVQLMHQGSHIDEGIIISFQHKLDIVIRDCILQDIVCLVQDGLVVGFVVDKYNVPVLFDLLCYLQQ